MPPFKGSPVDAPVGAAPPGAAEDYGQYGSTESVKSELAIFDGPSYQVTHREGKWNEYHPINLYEGTSGCNIIFKLTQSPGWYFDFNDSYMIVYASIETDAGVAVADELVAFENFGLATLFRDVSFSTQNQTKLEGENQHYHYRAYLYALLNAPYSAKKYQLSVSGWEKDTPGKFDSTYVEPGKDVEFKSATHGNSGFHIRRGWTKAGKAMEFCGQVFLDTWLQKQYFLDGQDFNLVFKLNPPALALHANVDTAKYKINIQKMFLYLRRVAVSPSVLIGHAKGLQKHNFVLPYNGHKVFHTLIKAGGRQISAEDFLGGVFPKAVIVALVDHDAYCGKYSFNPYNFQHFHCSECALIINGDSYPSTPYKPDFKKKICAREYYNMFLQLGKPGIFNDDNGMRLEDWVNGNTIYTFNRYPLL